jgi:hypothetical protein
MGFSTLRLHKKIELKDKFYINNIEINTLLFADDQVVLANPEDKACRELYKD